MINHIIEYSIRNRGLVILASLALAVCGLFAVWHTPIDAVPDLSENQAIVFTEWPGHSPREIEDQITYPLSGSLQSLEGIRVVRGSSDVNASMIWLIFDDGVDFATARARVHERLGGLDSLLPAGVTPRLAPDAIPTGQIFWYTVEGAGYDLARLRDIQDWFVRHQLESVPGVAEVASVGGQVLEYHVDLNPLKLRDRQVELPVVLRELARSNAAIGGDVVHKGNAEYIVRGVGWLGAAKAADAEPDRGQMLRDLENVLVPAGDGRAVRMAELGRIALGARPRRGILEKDGNEVVGGVVLMRYGQNALDVTRRLKAKIAELAAGLPAGVRIVTAYERTPLIEGAVRTVTGTLLEAMFTATICVVLVLMHFRTSFVIAVTLPLAALASFVIMWALRRLGIADIQTNIMSLAGIAISIGVLVDSSIVIAENVMHHLREKFGDEPVQGDTRAIVLAACQTVGQPIFFSVLIMLVSFLPVFALSGIDGKMYRPLAFTKTFALFSVAILAVTLVPALCTIFIKGRIRRETDSWVVRSVIDVYRPVLTYLFDKPGALVWLLGLTLVLGAIPIGNRWVLLPVLGTALVLAGLTLTKPLTRTVGMASLVLAALIGEQNMQPLAAEMRMPLDEGMVMDMPITIPRASSVQSGDDLKARDMVICRFPEVEMVLGKAGRAESPFDPAPLDMIESMVMLRPREFWPRRKITMDDAKRQAQAVYNSLLSAKLVLAPDDASARSDLFDAALADAMSRYDGVMREVAYQRNQEFIRSLEQTEHKQQIGHGPRSELWAGHVRRLNNEILDRAGPTFTRLVGEEILKRSQIADPRLVEIIEQVARARQIQVVATAKDGAKPQASGGGAHHGGGAKWPLPVIDPHPVLDAIYASLSKKFGASVMLWSCERNEMSGRRDGELDRAVSMPGWTNIWTMPIQNRVDMLNSGTNAEIAVRVLGRTQEDVIRVANDVAAVVRSIPGVAGASIEQIRGKGYLEIRPDREGAARSGVTIGDINDVVETAIGGRLATTTVEGRERHAVRVRFERELVRDEEAIRRLPIPVRDLDQPVTELASAFGSSGVLPRSPSPVGYVPLEEVAAVNIVEGPATIKSQNGLVRNFVSLSVRGQRPLEVVESARRAVAGAVELPEGTYLEWTGQFEHALATARTLLVVIPLVVASILLILYLTYRDWADACLMLLVVPGTVAGGVLFQWLFGFEFSVAVAVGYIACFGMAASTGMIMLVYLREAVAKAGGLEAMTLAQLRQAVMDGAVHRLRPKLLTEGTMILGLAPMLWASGVGAEVIRPMAAPVLGGILIADEVIDLLIPVLFYHIRKHRWLKLQSAAIPADQ